MEKSKSRSSKPSDFRLVKHYYAKSLSTSDRNLFHEIIRRKNIEYNQVGILSYASYFYKYLSLDTALLCINNGNIQFVEPSRWQDKYERRFYEANYESQTTNEKEDCPLLYATCMTTKRFNEAAWILYTYGKTGKGAFCVEFQINKHKFRQQLVNSISNDGKIYEGVVMYCGQEMIDNIHSKKVIEKGKEVLNKYHEKYVERKAKIPYRTNYLNLLLMKRSAFEHERETRFFYLKKDKVGTPKAQKVGEDIYGDATLLRIDWIEIIEKVFINAKEDSEEYNLLATALRNKLDERYPQKQNAVKLQEKKEIWENRLKPIPYFVYGEVPDKPLVME